jgi:hypothetical protein
LFFILRIARRLIGGGLAIAWRASQLPMKPRPAIAFG